MSLFTGVGVALVTLFNEDGSLDAGATGEHAARVVEAGVRAVLVAGSTGEAPALDPAERVRLIVSARDAVDGTVPVIAGTGAPDTRGAVRLTRDAVDAGADAVLALSPLRAGDPRGYYAAVADAAGDVPLLAYHFPGMSPPGIDVDVLADLPVAGLKDSSGDAERLLRELEAFDRPLFVGSSALLVNAGALGCAGAILALANLEPQACIAAFAGDAAAQRGLIGAHLTSRTDFPHGLKAALAGRYGTPQTSRMGS